MEEYVTTSIAWLAPICAVIGIAVAAYLANWVLKQNPGPDKMNNISLKIQQGAKAFLFSEYKLLIIFMVVVAVIMAVALDEVMGDRDKRRRIKEFFARKVGKVERIGYRMVTVAFVIWTIWHLVMAYGMFKDPIRITQQPLGYDQASGDGEIWASSYVKLKNISYSEITIEINTGWDKYTYEADYDGEGALIGNILI